MILLLKEIGSINLRTLLKSLYKGLTNDSVISYALISDFRSKYKDKYQDYAMNHELKFIPLIENINYVINLPTYKTGRICADIVYFLLFCEVEIFQSVNFIYNGEVMYSWDSDVLYLNQNYNYYIICYTFVKNVVCSLKSDLRLHSFTCYAFRNENAIVLFQDLSTLYVSKHDSYYIDIYVSSNRILDLRITRSPEFITDSKCLLLHCHLYFVRRMYSKLFVTPFNKANIYVTRNLFSIHTYEERYSIVAYDRLEFKDFDVHMLSSKKLTVFTIDLLSESRNYTYCDWVLFDKNQKILY